MTIEVRQMVIKSQVDNAQGSGKTKQTDSREQLRQMSQALQTETRRWLQDALERTKER